MFWFTASNILCFYFAATGNSFLRNLHIFHTLSRKYCQIVRFEVFGKFIIKTIQNGFIFESWEECCETQIQNKQSLKIESLKKKRKKMVKNSRNFQDIDVSELKQDLQGF